MKTSIFLLTMILFVAGCDTGKQAKEPLPGSITVSAIRDVTDKHRLWPIANPLLRLYSSKENPDAEYQFRLRTISDKVLTPVSSCRLPDGITTEKENKEDDPQFRKRNISAFYSRVREIVNEFSDPEDGLQSLKNSECIRTICDELVQLAASASTRKYLVVFSDLNEKSDLCDVYNGQGNPAKAIEEAILKKSLLPDRLETITVIFVFDPVDREQDQKYREIAQVYKQLIEKRGGRVFIQADNSSYPL